MNKNLISNQTIFYETIQSYGDKTFEIREGDLFLVNERLGTEKGLLDYGYVLSFFPATNLQKFIIVDRDILGQSLWLIKFDNLEE